MVLGFGIPLRSGQFRPALPETHVKQGQNLLWAGLRHGCQPSLGSPGPGYQGQGAGGSSPSDKDFSRLCLGAGGKKTMPWNGGPSRVFPVPPSGGEMPPHPKQPLVPGVLFYPLPLLTTWSLPQNGTMIFSLSKSLFFLGRECVIIHLFCFFMQRMSLASTALTVNIRQKSTRQSP